MDAVRQVAPTSYTNGRHSRLLVLRDGNRGMRYPLSLRNKLSVPPHSDRMPAREWLQA